MTKPKINKFQRDFPAEYEQGMAARAGSISRDDAPYAEGDQLDAWLAGYDDEVEDGGARARNETMNPEPAKASGQVATTSGSKKA